MSRRPIQLRTMYIDDDGRGTVFNNEREMIDAIKKDAKSEPPKVTTTQVLQIQQVIADAIKESGGSLYEDNGEVMDSYIRTILAILRLERE